jgi:nitrate/nitrite transport system substrate-binding protein
MSTFRNPFDPNVKLNGCACGRAVAFMPSC